MVTILKTPARGWGFWTMLVTHVFSFRMEGKGGKEEEKEEKKRKRRKRRKKRRRKRDRGN